MGLISGAIERLRRLLGLDRRTGGGGGGSGGTGGSGGGATVLVRVGITSETVAKYAEYLEHGWTQIVTPAQAGWLGAHGVHVTPGSRLVMVPRPVFARTAAQNREKWTRIVTNIARRQSPRIDPRQIAAFIGEVMRDDVKTQIATADGMAPRKSATLAIYSAEMDMTGHSASGTAGMTRTQPLVKTGAYLGSIDFEIRG